MSINLSFAETATIIVQALEHIEKVNNAATPFLKDDLVPKEQPFPPKHAQAPTTVLQNLFSNYYDNGMLDSQKVCWKKCNLFFCSIFCNMCKAVAFVVQVLPIWFSVWWTNLLVHPMHHRHWCKLKCKLWNGYAKWFMVRKWPRMHLVFWHLVVHFCKYLCNI